MSLEVLSPGRTVFYPDSEILTSEGIREKFHAWNAGKDVSSQMEAVGFVMPIEAEKAFLTSERAEGPFSGVHDEMSPFWADTQALGAAVTQIALHDMQRSDLQGNLQITILAGYYGANYREPLHTDSLSKRPSLRWLVTQGAGTTTGTKGHIKKADVLSVGDLHKNVLVGPGDQLELVEFPTGTAQRFMGIADIHAGPETEGARILAAATLYLKA